MRSFFVLLAILVLSQKLHSQQGYVHVQYVSRYYYQVQNVSYVPLQFTFESSSKPFLLMPGQKRIFSKHDHLDETLQVLYPKKYYSRKAKELDLAHFKLLGKDYLRGEAHDLIQDYNLKTGKNRGVGKTLLNASLVYLGNSYVEGILEDKINYIKWAINYNWLTYKGRMFIPQTIRQRMTLTKDRHRALLSRWSLNATVTPFKSGLNDSWSKWGGTFPFSITGSVFISPEVRWGKRTNLVTRLYGFLDYQTEGYNLRDNGNTLAIGSEYVASPDQEFYQLNNDQKGRSFEIRTVSVGGYLRAMIYPNIFFDFGAGYIVRQTGLLHFDPGKTEDPVNYLVANKELNGTEFDDVLEMESNKSNRLYGLFNIAFTIGNEGNDRGRPVEGGYVFLQSRLYHRDVLPSTSNYLYRIEQNPTIPEESRYERLAFVDQADKWRFSLQLGLGVYF